MTAGGHVTSVKFDYSGQYLAVGGADARVYGVKTDWSLLSTLTDLPQKVTAELSRVQLAQLLVVFLQLKYQQDMWP